MDRRSRKSPLNAQLQIILIKAMGELGEESSMKTLTRDALAALSRFSARPAGNGSIEDRNSVAGASLSAIEGIVDSLSSDAESALWAGIYLSNSLKDYFSACAWWKRYTSLANLILKWRGERILMKIDM